MTVVKLVLDESDKWARCSFTPKKKNNNRRKEWGNLLFFLLLVKLHHALSSMSNSRNIPENFQNMQRYNIH